MITDTAQQETLRAAICEALDSGANKQDTGTQGAIRV
jgi:hypothetical protein